MSKCIVIHLGPYRVYYFMYICNKKIKTQIILDKTKLLFNLTKIKDCFLILNHPPKYNNLNEKHKKKKKNQNGVGGGGGVFLP